MKITLKNKDNKELEILSFEQSSDLALLHNPSNTYTPYIVVYGLDLESKSWQQGHYFMSLDSAKSYMYNQIKEYYTVNELDQQSYRTLIDINKVDLMRQGSNVINELLQKYTDIEDEYFEECLFEINSGRKRITYKDIEELPFSKNGYDRCIGGEGSYILRNADNGQVVYVTNTILENNYLLNEMIDVASELDQQINTIEELTAENLNINDYGKIMQFMDERARKDENWTWFLDDVDIQDEEFTDDDIRRFYSDVDNLKLHRSDINEIIEFSDDIEDFKTNQPCVTFYGAFLEIFHDENELEEMGYYRFLENEEQTELE